MPGILDSWREDCRLDEEGSQLQGVGAPLDNCNNCPSPARRRNVTRGIVVAPPIKVGTILVIVLLLYLVGALR